MVDISAKAPSTRRAQAQARVRLGAEILALIADAAVPKGDVIACARIAGIQAAKKTSDLIPLCHPLALTQVSIDAQLTQEEIVLTSTCQCSGKTGVEMEALTAVSVAALTVYDMCKSLDKGISIKEVRLLSKSGGKSGDWHADGN